MEIKGNNIYIDRGESFTFDIDIKDELNNPFIIKGDKVLSENFFACLSITPSVHNPETTNYWLPLKDLPFFFNSEKPSKLKDTLILTLSEISFDNFSTHFDTDFTNADKYVYYYVDTKTNEKFFKYLDNYEIKYIEGVLTATFEWRDYNFRLSAPIDTTQMTDREYNYSVRVLAGDLLLDLIGTCLSEDELKEKIDNLSEVARNAFYEVKPIAPPYSYNKTLCNGKIYVTPSQVQFDVTPEVEKTECGIYQTLFDLMFSDEKEDDCDIEPHRKYHNWDRPKEWLPVPKFPKDKDFIYMLFRFQETPEDESGTYFTFYETLNLSIGNAATDNYTDYFILAQQGVDIDFVLDDYYYRNGENAFTYYDLPVKEVNGYKYFWIKIEAPRNTIKSLNFEINYYLKSLVELYIDCPELEDTKFNFGNYGGDYGLNGCLEHLYMVIPSSWTIIPQTPKGVIACEYLNTNNIEDFSKVYYNCQKLKYINKMNISKLDLQKNKQQKWFCNCKSLEFIPDYNFEHLDYATIRDREGIDTSRLFEKCYKLKAIPFKNIKFDLELQSCKSLGLKAVNDIIDNLYGADSRERTMKLHTSFNGAQVEYNKDASSITLNVQKLTGDGDDEKFWTLEYASYNF